MPPTIRARAVRLRWAGDRDSLARWQAGFAATAAAAPGFLALDILALDILAEDAPGLRWQIVERFRDAAALEAWRGHPARHALLAEATGGDPSAIAEQVLDGTEAEPATEVVVTQVPPGALGGFLAASAAIQRVQGRFPGYRGTSIQAPEDASATTWTTCIRFDTAAQLDAWLASPDRAALLREAGAVVARSRHRRLPASFAAWFAGPGAPGPPLWKQAALVLLVLFPVVMLEMRFLAPHLVALPPTLATFLGNALSVGIVTWPLMPLAVRAMGWWLRPRDRGAEILGLLLLGTVYAAEVALFWRA